MQRSTYTLRRSLTGVRKVVLPTRELVEVLVPNHDAGPADELASATATWPTT